MTPIQILEEMIDQLETKRENEKKYDKEKIDCSQHYIREALDRIEKETGWISVDERLPEDNEIVIGFTDENNFVICKVQKLSHCCFFVHDTLNCLVTHWQPLPPNP